MKFYLSALVILSSLLFSCQDNHPSDAAREEAAITFQNKGHELVYGMTQKVGDYQALLSKKDVVYTYTYETPDQKADVSTEKYIFDGELSYAAYHRHERTMPQLEGTIEQGYDGKEFWFRHQGEYLTDSVYVKRSKFSRKTNFYWFAMFQKLLDPGLNYEHLSDTTIEGKAYDVVRVSFETEDGRPTDIYQLYINQKTSLVDQFLFTIVDFNVVETPMLMRMEYEEVDGILIPTKRLYKKSTWDAEVTDEPWIKVTWSDIRFDNQLDRSLFEKA